ncbi:hypothetical protein C4559_02930 [Candidatus Microgenomates bacterium]|nr:MAG: hypothetical protein C4559_02930 [Candidatus Microgenomates bacterium]
MPEIPKHGQQPEEDPLQIAQTFLDKQRKASGLLAQLNSSSENAVNQLGIIVNVFHEVFVVGKVVPYCPKDRGGKQMGWGIYSINPTIFSDENLTITKVEVVNFGDVDNMVPATGDLAHIRRENSWAGARLSIEIIKDMPTKDEKQKALNEVEGLFNKPQINN